jgi:hypothetical protein
MPFYEVVAYKRNQQSSSAPTFTELDRVMPHGGEASEGGGLSWSKELLSEGSITVATDPTKLESTIASYLRTPVANPLEFGLFRDGTLVQRGPLVAWQIEGKTLVLHIRGLLYYARYMVLTTDLKVTKDQALIAKDLIDHHQAKSYGNFGLDTSGITSHGVSRSRDYKATELINIIDEIRELGESDNGFDISCNPSTRVVTLHYPKKGTDKSATVAVDTRGITDPRLALSIASGQFGTAAFVSGVAGGQTSVTSESITTTERSTFGLAYITHTSVGVTNVSELANIAIESRDIAKLPVFTPNKEFWSVTGASVDDFDVGDTITFEYDPGIGYMTYVGRVKNIYVSVQEGSQEKLTLEFM